MNNKIKKFAKEAGYSGGFDDPEEIEQIGNDFSYFDIENFSELIIKECAKILANDTESLTAFERAEKIKQHFKIKN